MHCLTQRTASTSALPLDVVDAGAAMHSMSGHQALIPDELKALKSVCAPLCRFQPDHIQILRQQQNSESASLRGTGLKLAASSTPMELLSDTLQFDSACSRGWHTTFHSSPAARACFSSFACKITQPLLLRSCNKHWVNSDLYVDCHMLRSMFSFRLGS